MITLLSPENNQCISILTPIQREFTQREYSLKILPSSTDVPDEEPYPWLSPDPDDVPGISAPACIIFKWKNSFCLPPVRFEISLNPDFSPENRIGKIATVGQILYVSDCDSYQVPVTNLLSGTTYYWRVSTDSESSEIRSFTTNYGEIRPIGGVSCSNIRDMGGRINSCGKRIKQGLVYRGGALNDIVTPDSHGFNGLLVMRDDLAIKTDIDLRWEAVGKYEYCPIGDHVKYRLFTLEAYDGILQEGQQGLFKSIFELIADESNYPIYFHCVAGADRTGTVAILLDAILGMSEEDIIFNYNFTSIYSKRSWYHSKCISLMAEALKAGCGSDSLIDMLMYFVRYCGISEDTIKRIRNNLLEQ